MIMEGRVFILIIIKKIYMQTPVMNMPYDMSVYDKGEYPKYS